MLSGRFPFCLVLAAWLVGGVALAQAEGEGTSWTDPPARTAPQEPGTPADKPPDAKPPEPARTERPPEPAVKSEPTQARRSPSAPAQPAPTPTQAEQRQEQIRRAVARSTAQREAEAARAARMPRRSVVERPAPPRRHVERPLRLSERPAPSVRESLAARPRSLRRPVYGYADPVPAYDRYEGGPRVWDEGPPDGRARRIAQARSAGYLVIRSRSYAYPDGVVVRRLAPLGEYDFYD